MKRGVPLLITFVVGWVLVIAYFIPHWPFNTFQEDFSIYFDIMAAVAFVLGGGNLVRIHLERIGGKKPGWGYSAVCMVGFFVTLVLGLLKIKGTLGSPSINLTDNYLADGTWFKIAYQALFKPLVATMFALLGFYVATASYRAFRARNLEATLLLATAFIILLGRTFVGYLLTAWLPESLHALTIPEIANWIMAVPNQAGNRAIMIGIALGIVSLSLRVMLGIERSYLGREGD